MKIESIYIINAANDPGIVSIVNDYSFPALGVLALGTWIEQKFPDMKVYVRDNGVFSTDKIIEEMKAIKPSIVAISVLSVSYENSMVLAKSAKDLGAWVVLGNDHASQLAKEIVTHRSFVDFVLGSEYGESPLGMLLEALINENIPFESIPDLTYREGNIVKGFDYESNYRTLSIVSSKAYNVSGRDGALDIFPIPNRRLYPSSHWQQYLKNYLRHSKNLHQQEVTGVTTINRARGCPRKKDKCKYCDMLLDISFSSPEVFWRDVFRAHEEVKANVFYEVCDSFSSFPKYVQSLVSSKPHFKSFHPEFFVYCQAIDLVRSPELIKNLKRLGVYKINMGLESGSNRTLKKMKSPRDSVEVNYKALQQAKSLGIHVYSSFVLGTDAETKDTLAETQSWIKKIMDEELVCDIEVNPVFPLPNTFYGKKLEASGLMDFKNLDSDWPHNTNDLSKNYINHFSSVSYEDVIEVIQSVRQESSGSKANVGSGFSKAQELMPVT